MASTSLASACTPTSSSKRRTTRAPSISNLRLEFTRAEIPTAGVSSHKRIKRESSLQINIKEEPSPTHRNIKIESRPSTPIRDLNQSSPSTPIRESHQSSPSTLIGEPIRSSTSKSYREFHRLTFPPPQFADDQERLLRQKHDKLKVKSDGGSMPVDRIGKELAKLPSVADMKLLFDFIETQEEEIGMELMINHIEVKTNSHPFLKNYLGSEYCESFSLELVPRDAHGMWIQTFSGKPSCDGQSALEGYIIYDFIINGGATPMDCMNALSPAISVRDLLLGSDYDTIQRIYRYMKLREKMDRVGEYYVKSCNDVRVFEIENITERDPDEDFYEVHILRLWVDEAPPKYPQNKLEPPLRFKFPRQVDNTTGTESTGLESKSAAVFNTFFSLGEAFTAPLQKYIGIERTSRGKEVVLSSIQIISKTFQEQSKYGPRGKPKDFKYYMVALELEEI